MARMFKTIKAKLLPCANCGGPATLTRGVTGIYAVVCPCGSHVFYGAEWSAEKTTAAWNRRADNTRAERACEMYRDEHGIWHCKSCESGADTDTGSDGALDSWDDSWAPNYCPNCGARVVEVSGHAGE